MKPIRMSVDTMTCTQCSWQHRGEDWSLWWAHLDSEHPGYAAYLRAARDALGDTGTYDTAYEEAVLRLAGKVWAVWKDQP